MTTWKMLVNTFLKSNAFLISMHYLSTLNVRICYLFNLSMGIVDQASLYVLQWSIANQTNADSSASQTTAIY